MRKPDSWPELLQIEPAFLVLEQNILAEAIRDYRQIDPQAFAWHGWDLIPEARLFSMLLPFLRQQVGRARTAMPGLYAGQLAGIDPSSIQSQADWQRLPLLVKDDDPQKSLRGFRQIANQNPLTMRPQDTQELAAVAFGSGGSQSFFP